MKVKLGKQTINVKGGVRLRLKGGIPLPEELPDPKAKLDLVNCRAHLTTRYHLTEKDGVYTLELEAVIDKGEAVFLPPDAGLFDDVELAANPHEFVPGDPHPEDNYVMCQVCGDGEKAVLHRTDPLTGEIRGEEPQEEGPDGEPE